MPTEIALKVTSPSHRFVRGTVDVVPSKNPADSIESQSSAPVPGFMSNELAHALVAGASEQVSLPLVEGLTKKFKGAEAGKKLLVVLTDVAIQRIGGAKVVHVPILHAGIVEVTQGDCDRGVVEIVVPIKKIIRIKVLNKQGRPAPDQWLSIHGANEQPNRTTEVRSNKEGEFIILGTTPGHYIVETDEGESAIVQVDARDSGEEVEVILQKQK